MMQIGFLETYPTSKVPEKENIIRIKKVFEKFGHTLSILSPEGFNSSGIHADELNLDFVFTPDNTAPGMEILPDCIALSIGWVPCGYLMYYKFQKFVTGISAFDGYVPAFDSISTDYILNNFTNGFIKLDDYFYPSVSEDDVIEPKILKDYKIFYVGINLDKGKSKGRHYSLLKTLDEKNILNLYGPNNIGGTVCWEGFKNYKGEIPFDGVSILKEINKTGICLALQSKIHNKEEYVTNRIYEACASGAVIITDDNPKIRKIFNDSLYYVDISQDEDKIIEDVLKIYESIKSNPKIAYAKAKDAQEIFLSNFTLEKSVKNLITAYKKVFADLNDKNKQKEQIDIIAFIDNKDDVEKINKQLLKQYYKNIKVYFSTKINFLLEDIHYNYEIINTQENSYGKRFLEIKDKLKGDYFMFVNSLCDMQKRHLLKLLNKMNTCENMYCYTGTYLKDSKSSYRYKVLNDKTIPLCEYFSLISSEVQYENEKNHISKSLDIENNYALHSFMFKKNILNNIKEIEMQYINRAIHLYIALITIYKEKDYGFDISSISCGYSTLQKNIEINNHKYYIDIDTDAYVDFNRCSGLTITELYTVFKKYNVFNCKNNINSNSSKKMVQLIREWEAIDKKITQYKLKRIIMPNKYNKKINTLLEKKADLLSGNNN